MSWLDWCVSWAACMSSSANYYSVKPRRRMSEFWPQLGACGRRTTPASGHSPGTSAPPRSAYLPYTHTCQLSLLSTMGREIRTSSGVHLLVPCQLSLLSTVGRKIKTSSGVRLLAPRQLSLLSTVGRKIKTSSGVRLLAPRQLSLLSTVGREIRTSSSGMSTVYTHQCTFIVHITPNYQALSNYAVRLVRQRVDSIQYRCKKRLENFFKW